MKNRLPETGEGLHGERLSSLPNTSEDFPAPGAPINLGEAEPSSDAHPSPLETHLPISVSANEILKRGERYSGNIGATRDGGQ